WAKLTNYDFIYDGAVGSTNSGNQQQPVTKISWRDAIVWCNALTEYFNATNPGTTLACVYRYNGAIVKNAKDATACDNVTAVSTAKGFRLPTSNEWELAARYKDGKNWTPGNYASGATADYNNAIATAAVAVYGANNTEIVKNRNPNALGLYDMSGNVNQFCFDLYPGSDQSRVLRGGCWGYPASNVRIGFVYSDSTNNTYEGTGFRLARTQ
ncbi:MAG: formylglycine-generating enzyme family protein, partial [Bacteroidota bacterium]